MQYYQNPSELGLPILKLFIQNPVGECRQTIYLMERKYNWGFNMSSAVKYLWRVGVKDADTASDLTKAINYLTWELECPHGILSEDKRISLKTAIKMCRDLLE